MIERIKAWMQGLDDLLPGGIVHSRFDGSAPNARERSRGETLDGIRFGRAD